MREWMRRVRRWWRHGEADADLAAEIEFHRLTVQERLEAQGVAKDDAARQSRRVLGNVTLAREDARQTWGWPSLERLWQDVRYGARMLRRNPTFTAVAVLTLALGIGANTAMFSVVNGVLLRPLPYQEPDRLVSIAIADVTRDVRDAGTSYPTFTDWRTQSRRFTDLAIWARAAARIHAGGDPERVPAAFVSANLFSLLGVRPALGRTFTADEERDRERVVVLSHSVWQRQFGSDPGVLDRMLEVDGETPGGMAEPLQRVRIVGVMPDGFFFPTKDVQFWRPATLLGIDGKPKLYERQWTDRFVDTWHVVARLGPQTTVGDAQSDLRLIGQRLEQAFPVPGGRAEFPGFSADVTPLALQLTGRDLVLALWVLVGAVGCVLVIACANVASLLLARGTAREREFAIRTALGAGRVRIVRQLCVESLLLAASAAVVGVGLAVFGVRTLSVITAPGIPRLDEVAVDGTVLTFTAAIAVLTGLLFGLAPAWETSRATHHEALKETSTATSGARRLTRKRGVLVVAECALAVILLAGAGLLVRSFMRLQSVDPGFNPAGVLLVRIDLPITPDLAPLAPGATSWREREWATYQEITDRVSRIPGVAHTGLVQSFLVASNPRTPITIEGRAFADEALERTAVNVEDTTPGFFEAMGVPLKRGRPFAYGEQNAPLAIVNETFVRRFFAGEDPVGKRFSQGEAGGKMYWQTIVGVVGDMHRQGLDRQPIPEFFIPSSEPAMDLAVRVNGDPARFAAAVRHEIRSVYPPTIILRMTTMESFMGEWSAERRFQTWLLSLFASAALVLAGIGIYGLMQFAMAQRAREIGIRIALGAERRDVLLLIVSQGMRPPLVGLAIGLASALALTRLLEHSLFAVSATDPATLASVAGALIVAALIACYLPARRASNVNPVVALRNE